MKREIRKEQEITDLEVMLEEKEGENEGKSSLEKWLLVYIQERIKRSGAGQRNRYPAAKEKRGRRKGG